MILEFHTHSKYSFDSITSPEKIIKASMKKGLDGVAVTDHGTIKGGLEARSFAPDGFTAIVGCEVYTEAGDIIGLFLNEEIKSKSCLEVIDEIRGQGGVVVLPHPFRGHRLSAEIVSAVDAIETFNSRSSMDGNLKADALSIEYGKPAMAGSDAHFSLEIGLGRTSVNADDYEGIRSAILSGDVYACLGVQSRAYLHSSSQFIKVARMGRYRHASLLMARAIMDFVLKS